MRCKKFATVVSSREYVARPLSGENSKHEYRNITATQVKTGKHEFRNVTATLKGRATYFRPETFVAFFGVIIQNVIHSFLKTPVRGASLS